MDSVFARLSSEYELMSLQAVLARQEFLLVTLAQGADHKSVTEARDRWHELQDRCAAILGRIKELTQATAA